ncbi:alkylhydroperoxidase [Mycobacterium sp. djl-10]|nr:alkylhydroperoxidase [Mycobacterium sp. djl-10]
MQSSRHSHETLDALWLEQRALRQAIPEVYQSFDDLSAEAMADGALTTRCKVLIALAIAVVQDRDGAVAASSRAAVQAGVTVQEAAEAIGVAIMMQGDPATFSGAQAYAAFCEFEDAVIRP